MWTSTPTCSVQKAYAHAKKRCRAKTAFENHLKKKNNPQHSLIRRWAVRFIEYLIGPDTVLLESSVDRRTRVSALRRNPAASIMFRVCKVSHRLLLCFLYSRVSVNGNPKRFSFFPDNVEIYEKLNKNKRTTKFVQDKNSGAKTFAQYRMCI